MEALPDLVFFLRISGSASKKYKMVYYKMPGETK